MKLKGNILIMTQWSYKDALIQTYTLPYVRIIREILPKTDKIIVVTAEKSMMALSTGELEEINRELALMNMRIFSLKYENFGWRKFFIYPLHFLKLIKLVKREKISVIHAFCMPAGSIAYMLSRFTGKTLVMDSYEPHATAMVETGAWKKNGPAFRLLFSLEKKLSKKATHVIAATEGMRDYAKKKYAVDLKSFFVKPACIDFSHFYPRPKDEKLMTKWRLQDKVVMVYAGKLGGTYLRDEVFDFAKACYNHWGDRFCFLMLTSESPQEIEKHAKRMGLPADAVISDFIPHKDIPRYLSLGDFAINPQVPVPSKRFGTPIKNGEYWAMGLPVVISPGISDDSDIIRENKIGIIVNLEQKENFSNAVKQMESLLNDDTREVLQKKIFSIAEKYRSFEIARSIYPLIYESR